MTDGGHRVEVTTVAADGRGGTSRDGVDVQAGDERIEVDACDDRVHVQARDQRVDVDAARQLVDVDVAGELVGVDVAQHGGGDLTCEALAR